MRKPTLLLVDDEPTNIRILVEVLKDEYDLVIATSGQQALEQVNEHQDALDLILLDMNMPGMNGMEVLQQINQNLPWGRIPVIFVTARNEEGDEATGLQGGAVDYITKPISGAIVRARVKTQLALRQAKMELEAQNRILEEKVKERTEEIQHTQDVIINALTSLAETRDNETGAHIIRTQYYVKTLAELIRSFPEYAHELDNDENIEAMFKTAPLHDVGKVGIPDRVLLKPGKLDDEEWEVMRTHPTLGGDALRKAAASLKGRGARFLKYAEEIAYGHHEKWDGSGYPQGLAGDAIPISARLMAIADVYDALISRRCYKDPMSHEQALDIMREGKGKHFDPVMLQVFLDNDQLFRAIAEEYKDED
ncbi:MAG: response regulator [Oleiphilaceae bacterium]|nr:response regulator [Oleiphilaceae bacterium]